MNSCQKLLSTGLLALFSQAAFAQAPDLGDASGFTVLGGTAVTCTASTVVGDVGSGGAFTNTGCTILGRMPPATNEAANDARDDFLAAYDAVRTLPCTNTLLSTITGPVTLTPGVYCTGAALTGAGVLTLDAQGDPDAVWIFQIGTEATGALTGTNFTVTMVNGGQACNVFWAPSAAVTLTDSAFKGNILAGNATEGSITLTRGTLAGRALADVAVTMTDAALTGCDALSGSLSCKVKKQKNKGRDRDRDDDDDDDGDRHDDDDDDDDDDGGKKKKKGKSPFKN